MALSVYHLEFIDIEASDPMSNSHSIHPVGFVITASSGTAARGMAAKHVRDGGYAVFGCPIDAVWNDSTLTTCKRIGSSFNVDAATIHLISHEGE